MSPRPIRVLESFPEPRATTNPYITQLARALDETPGVELVLYDPRTALLGRYDIFHVHWPENLVGGHKRVGRVARRLHAALLCLRLLVTRTPVVRTWHNLDRPPHLGRIDNLILDWLDALTVTRIVLNDVTDPQGHDVSLIAHGHYRDWFSPMPVAERESGRIAFAGLIRPYKGVDSLVEAFRKLPNPSRRLGISGKADPIDAERLRRSAAADPRIEFDFRYISEDELVRTITRAAVVALPYRRLHNSGALLAALSLDRPVLVPDTDAARSLAAEVGEEWVVRYDGALSPADLSRALDRAETIPAGARPDLSRREWSDAGEAHLSVFTRALSLRRGRR